MYLLLALDKKRNVSHFNMERPAMQTLILKCLVVLLGVLLQMSVTETYAQNSSGKSNNASLLKVTGQVLDEKNTPLAGVTVHVKNAKKQFALTDLSGRFSIGVSDRNAILVFDYVGYQTSEEKAADNLTVHLKTSDKNLEDVVTIAYGTQKARDVTGAMASIKNDAINDVPAVSFEELLKGQVAGVQVSASSGTPGAAINVNIRGISSITASTQPLYVIDGVPMAGGDVETDFSEPRTAMDFLDPSDIQSIEVLKDASATSIYGARGANGVILITTKKGSVGISNVVFSATTGISTLAHKIQMMTTRQAQEYWELAKQRDGQVLPPLDSSRLDVNTDWQRVITQNVPSQSYHLGFEGGQQTTQYNLSFNYSDQDGLLKYTGYTRYGIYGTLSTKVNKKLSITDMINITRSNNRETYTAGPGGTNSTTDAVRRMLLAPTYSVPNDSVPGVDEETGQIYVDPLVVLKDLHDNINTTNIIERITLKYNVLPGLDFQSMTGATYRFMENDQYQGPQYAATKTDTRITAKVVNYNTYDYVNENTLTYTKAVDEHHFTFLLGNTIEQSATSDQSITAIGFPNANTGTNALQEGEDDSVSSNKLQWQLASFYGRLNYDYMNRYLLTATLRRDGSSRLASGHKWGTFPSIGIGWNISDEKFFQKIDFVSHLKLRGSWGQIGNSDIGVYQTLSTISAGTNGFDNELLPYYTLNRYGDANLKWETTEQTDIGLDLDLFNSKVSITTDVFDKKTKDLLLARPTPFSSGYSSYLTNVGSMRNKGFEFTINYRIIDRKKFSWTTNLNFSTLSNKITALGGEDTVGIGNQVDGKYPRYLAVGKSIGTFFLVKTAGVWQLGEEAEAAKYGAVPGDWKYVDQNHDNVIDNSDRTFIGNSTPKYTIGFSNNFRYKKFDLMILLAGDFGAQTLNTVAPNLWQARENGGAAYDLKAWSPSNPTNNLAAPSISYNNDFLSDAYLENADIIRIQNLRLGYRWNFKPGNKASLYIYFSGNNLWSWSGYKGYDPEVGNGINSGIDRFSYPRARVYNFGAQLTF